MDCLSVESLNTRSFLCTEARILENKGLVTSAGLVIDYSLPLTLTMNGKTVRTIDTRVKCVVVRDRRHIYLFPSKYDIYYLDFYVTPPPTVLQSVQLTLALISEDISVIYRVALLFCEV